MARQEAAPAMFGPRQSRISRNRRFNISRGRRGHICSNASWLRVYRGVKAPKSVALPPRTGGRGASSLMFDGGLRRCFVAPCSLFRSNPGRMTCGGRTRVSGGGGAYERGEGALKDSAALDVFVVEITNVSIL